MTKKNRQISKKGQQLCRQAPNFSEAKTELGSHWNEITGIMRENLYSEELSLKKKNRTFTWEKTLELSSNFPTQAKPLKATLLHTGK